jgi:hypothetical protein
MKASSTVVRLICARDPATAPSQFPEPMASTGTVDDDDEPEDEHAGENEASVRETSDATEARQEFETDDEDIRDPGS